MTEIKDDRTAEQRETHRVLVVGTDRFLSGWGRAANGASYAAWACRPEHADMVERWVRARGDMRRVRVIGGDYRPGPGCAHLHVYVADVERIAASVYGPNRGPDVLAQIAADAA